MVKPGPMPPGEHNKVESIKPHKLGKFPKMRAAGRATIAAGKDFSKVTDHNYGGCFWVENKCFITITSPGGGGGGQFFWQETP